MGGGGAGAAATFGATVSFWRKYCFVPRTVTTRRAVYGPGESVAVHVAFIAPDDTPNHPSIHLSPPTDNGPTYEPLKLPASLVADIRAHPQGAWQTTYEGKDLVLVIRTVDTSRWIAH